MQTVRWQPKCLAHTSTTAAAASAPFWGSEVSAGSALAALKSWGFLGLCLTLHFKPLDLCRHEHLCWGAGDGPSLPHNIDLSMGQTPVD